MRKVYHLTCKVVSLLCSTAGVLLGRREAKEADKQHSHWLAAIPLTNCAQFISSGCCPSRFINLFKVSIKSSLVPCHFCHCWAEIIAKYDNYLPEPAPVWEGRGFQEFHSELFQVSNSHVCETAEPHRKISCEKSETRQSHDLPWRAPLLKPFKQFEECLPCFQTMHPKTKPSVTLCEKISDPWNKRRPLPFRCCLLPSHPLPLPQRLTEVPNPAQGSSRKFFVCAVFSENSPRLISFHFEHAEVWLQHSSCLVSQLGSGWLCSGQPQPAPGACGHVGHRHHTAAKPGSLQWVTENNFLQTWSKL